MSSDAKYLLSVVTLVTAAVAAFLGWKFGWALWPVPLLLPVALAVGFLSVRRTGTARARNGSRATGAEALYQAPYASPQPSGLRENTITDIALPSAAAAYNFLFSATVHWRLLSNLHPTSVPAASVALTTPNANPAALAIEAVLLRARQVAALEDPAECASAQVRLTSALGVVVRDVSGQVEAWATNVTLRLTDEDLRRLRKIADVRKELEVWEYEREYERSKRAYLGEDVLKSTGSAVVWLLSRQDDAIERTVDMIGPLARLAAAANDQEVPEMYRHLVPPFHGGANGFAHGAGHEDLPADPSLNGFERETDRADGVGQPETAADRVVKQVGAILEDLDLTPDNAERALYVHRIVEATNVVRPDVATSIAETFDPPGEDAGNGQEPLWEERSSEDERVTDGDDPGPQW